MSKRIPPSERTSQRIADLLAHGGDGDVKSNFIQLAVAKVVEELLEAEVTDVIGRDYYRHRSPDAGEDEHGGYRNGYRTGRLKTAEGAVEYAAPQVSDREQPFRSPRVSTAAPGSKCLLMRPA